MRKIGKQDDDDDDDGMEGAGLVYRMDGIEMSTREGEEMLSKGGVFFFFFFRASWPVQTNRMQRDDAV